MWVVMQPVGQGNLVHFGPFESAEQARTWVVQEHLIDARVSWVHPATTPYVDGLRVLPDPEDGSNSHADL